MGLGTLSPLHILWPTGMGDCNRGHQALGFLIVVSSSVGFFPFPSLKTHKQNPKLLWPKCVTYGAISESALGTKLVLHCHFCDNEGRKAVKAIGKQMVGTQCGLPRRQRLWGWAQHPDSGSRLKKDTCKTSFAEKTAFLLGNLQYVTKVLKNVWNHCSSNLPQELIIRKP